MTSVITKGKINASPDQVWAIVSKFEELDKYFPPVARSEGSGSGVGMERQCTFHDGAQITETLLAMDDGKRSLTYNVHDPNPFPFTEYVATMRVDDLGEGNSEFEWSAQFKAQGMADEEVVDLLDGLFKQGIDGIRELTSGA